MTASFAESESAAPAASAASALTPRERLLRALRGQPAGRVPVWLMRQAGRYLPEYQAVRRHYSFLEMCKTPAAAAEVSLQPLSAIGSEAVIIFNDILLPLEHAGAQVEFDERGPLIRNAVRAPADLPAAPPRAPQADEPVALAIAEVRRRAGDETPILGFIGAPWTLAAYWIEGRAAGGVFAAAARLRAADPPLLEALLERIAGVVADYLRVQILAGADAVQIFDTWGGLLSPTEYARFSAPSIRAIIRRLRADARCAATPVILFVKGAAPLLPQLAGLGADCLSLDPACDLAQTRAWLAEQRAQPDAPLPAALQGNLDPQILLAGPEAAERAARGLFQRFAPGPGHVFNLGHGILPQTSPEAARRLVQAVKQYGSY